MNASPQAGPARISVPPHLPTRRCSGARVRRPPREGLRSPAGRFGHIGPSESVLLIGGRTGALQHHLTHFPIPE
jgi:hypothetical protein